MENASKALIIAGAILISILLIGVGVMVLNSTDNITSGVGDTMNAKEIEAFNREFTMYTGQQRGSTIKALMDKVSASNASHGEDKEVKVEFGSYTTVEDIISNVTNSKKYTVSVSMGTGEADGGTKGLVHKITITE